MPEGKKNTAPIPAPVRDEDGYSAKTHLHRSCYGTAGRRTGGGAAL